MKPTLEDKLVRTFPTLYQDRHASMMETCMCWGFECGDGWYKIIWGLSEKLEPICKNLTKKLTEEQIKMGARYCASQVKEKYGILRFYTTFDNDDAEKFIEKAEKLSAKTCEKCGGNGSCINYHGWFLTRCPKCLREYKDGHVF